jgi:hypothetical protein
LALLEQPIFNCVAPGERIVFLPGFCYYYGTAVNLNPWGGKSDREGEMLFEKDSL